MSILIFPFARPLRNGKPNPKDYPFWKELIQLLHKNNYEVIQTGVSGEQQLVDDCRFNLTLDQLANLILATDTWIGVDSFGQHYAWDLQKPGIVLWGQSDPNIFGHPENINLLKDRKYLREKQFWLWEQCEYRTDVFVEPELVLEALVSLTKNKT